MPTCYMFALCIRSLISMGLDIPANGLPLSVYPLTDWPCGGAAKCLLLLQNAMGLLKCRQNCPVAIS